MKKNNIKKTLAKLGVFLSFIGLLAVAVFASLNRDDTPIETDYFQRVNKGV